MKKRLAITILLAALAIALVRVASAIKTNEIELGENSVYDGAVKIERDGSGNMTWVDEIVTTPLSLTTVDSHLDDSDIHLDGMAAESVTGVWNFVNGLGIGASSPATTLDVSGNARITSNVYIGDGSNYRAIFFDSRAGGNFISDPTKRVGEVSNAGSQFTVRALNNKTLRLFSDSDRGASVADSGDVSMTDSLDVSGDVTVGDEFFPDLLSQASEPTLSADGAVVAWEDSDDGDQTYLVYRRGSGDQLKAHLTSENPAQFTKRWPFKSKAGASGTVYVGGFYEFASSDNDFSASPTFGTPNKALGAQVFVVLGAATVDELTIRASGTSITDAGVRTGSDTEDIVIPNSTAVDSYFETTKKWLGQVTISVQSGTAKTCNYGFVNYWNNNSADFRVTGCEAAWLAGANDSNVDLQVIHHKAAGWTFNSGAPPTPPLAIAAMTTDYSTDDQTVSGEQGAWRRTGLSTDVDADNGEGVIVAVVTSANGAFDLGSFTLIAERE